MSWQMAVNSFLSLPGWTMTSKYFFDIKSNKEIEWIILNSFFDFPLAGWKVGTSSGFRVILNSELSTSMREYVSLNVPVANLQLNCLRIYRKAVGSSLARCCAKAISSESSHAFCVLCQDFFEKKNIFWVSACFFIWYGRLTKWHDTRVKRCKDSSSLLVRVRNHLYDSKNRRKQPG